MLLLDDYVLTFWIECDFCGNKTREQDTEEAAAFKWNEFQHNSVSEKFIVCEFCACRTNVRVRACCDRGDMQMKINEDDDHAAYRLQVKKMLLKYGTHTADCKIWRPYTKASGPNPCSCGWEEVRKQVEGD